MPPEVWHGPLTQMARSCLGNFFVAAMRMTSGCMCSKDYSVRTKGFAFGSQHHKRRFTAIPGNVKSRSSRQSLTASSRQGANLNRSPLCGEGQRICRAAHAAWPNRRAL
jgi:hypothetical protein